MNILAETKNERERRCEVSNRIACSGNKSAASCQQSCCKLSTILLQVVNNLAASCQQSCCKCIVKTFYQEAGYKFFKQLSCSNAGNIKLHQI